jgi:hypothetical protein
VLIAALSVAVLAACTTTVGGSAVRGAALAVPVEQILPTVAEVSAAVGNTLDPGGFPASGGIDLLPNGIRDDSVASPIDCLGPVMPFMRVVYEKDDVRTAAWQEFSRFGAGEAVSSADAGVVGFGSDAEAQRVFVAFTATWRACEGTTVTTHTRDADLYATITEVRVQGPILSATILTGDSRDASRFPTERALGVAQGRIVDVDVAVTGSSPADRVAAGRAVKLAEVMLEKVNRGG